ncbi:MAG: MBOAT family protein [Myxococcales bacterium]|nr:MBOAT family protein [Myxococcales bacterium]
MAFNSLEYVLLLGLTALLFFRLGYRGRLALLIASSLVFYGAFSVPLLSLIVISALVDYTCGLRIARAEGQTRRKRWLALSVAVNLGLLAYFKYANFFLDNLGALTGDLSAHYVEVLLPPGISFYTFQTMSYTIDVYRRRIRPTTSFLRFFLYVSFFPQLIAGPIERAGHLLVQFDHAASRRFRLANLVAGLQMIAWGMFKKAVLADHCGAIADRVYADPSLYDGWSALVATYAFTLQIYLDFSAYSEIARGSARIFGVDLMVNFDQPYLARNISDFWRRWHISLSEWFRDYVYIPLGGSRGTKRRTLANLTITMFLSGLWHGAAWNFVLWGLFHGVLLLVHALARPLLRAAFTWPRLGPLGPLGPLVGGVVGWFVTLHLVVIGWVLFRVEAVADANLILALIRRSLIDGRGAPRPEHLGFIALFAGFIALSFADRRFGILARINGDAALSATFYAAIVALTLLLAKGDGAAFIYFQF